MYSTNYNFKIRVRKLWSAQGNTSISWRWFLADIKYLNGKLKENTEYAVFQRSFDQDENYENEGLIQFTTKSKLHVCKLVSNLNDISLND